MESVVRGLGGVWLGVSSCVGKRERGCVKEKKTRSEGSMFTVDGELVECLGYKRFFKKKPFGSPFYLAT